MPEHRPGTPPRLSELESFLWNDFEAGLKDWNAWVQRKMPQCLSAGTAERSFGNAILLHQALRSLQAANSGIATDEEVVSRQTVNSLVAHYEIHPRLGEHGSISLTSNDPKDAVALLILATLDAMHAGIWVRFKLCQEPTCRASYYDASKSAAKTWCSMETCGSRNKMRRYRAKT
jgi:predicted RNA-binding Zn ribbon-like protein